jgi:hypothetical protein
MTEAGAAGAAGAIAGAAGATSAEAKSPIASSDIAAKSSAKIAGAVNAINEAKAAESTNLFINFLPIIRNRVHKNVSH